ncbi:MAG: Sec-independent protein translocase protein TatB [Granulosicoccaceae bacterium]|jgi:sec-independent protein translocase protein TatB
MFDIGFFELILIGIVALLVIGPERLPGVARTAGLWVGKMRNFVSSVKDDIDQELKADELKRVMKQHAESTSVHEIIEQTKEAAEEIKRNTYAVRAIPDEAEEAEAEPGTDTDEAEPEQPDTAETGTDAGEAEAKQPDTTRPATDNKEQINKYVIKPDSGNDKAD